MAKIIFACLFIYALFSVIEKQGMSGVKEVALSVGVFFVLLAIIAMAIISVCYVAI
jgi:hypothetical protein